MTPEYRRLLERRRAGLPLVGPGSLDPVPSGHAALVRGDDGGLHLRRFPTAEAANAVAASTRDFHVAGDAANEAKPKRAPRGEILLSEAAELLGVSAKTFKKYIAHIRHRQPSPNKTYVLREELPLLRAHGLHGLARLRAAQAIRQL